MSATRQRALDELVPLYLVELPIASEVPLIVEIGCGKGDATAAMAGDEKDHLVLGCEVNDATIANLATLLDAGNVENVRLWVGDAFELLLALGPSRVSEVRAWFPDPWPKPRHAHKRLVTPERIGVITDSLAVGGRLRIATDDPGYADETLLSIGAESRLRGAVVERPVERPITTFEARGIREGRHTIDIEAVRVR